MLEALRMDLRDTGGVLDDYKRGCRGAGYMLGALRGSREVMGAYQWMKGKMRRDQLVGSFKNCCV